MIVLRPSILGLFGILFQTRARKGNPAELTKPANVPVKIAKMVGFVTKCAKGGQSFRHFLSM